MSATEGESMGESKAPRVCHLCGLASTVKCGGCREARYCTRACQKAHWREHKLLCQQIQAKRDKKAARRRELGEALIEASGRGQLSDVRGLLAAGLTRLMSDTEDGHKSSYKTKQKQSRG